MPLKANEATTQLETYTTGPLPAGFGALFVLNEAGEFLVNMHPWTFLKRQGVALEYTAGQPHIPLPDVFSKVLSITSRESTERQWEECTTQEMDRLRSQFANDSSLTTYWCISYEEIDADGGEPRPRLEIYPPMPDDSSNGIVLSYLAGWRPVTSDDPNIPIPGYVQPLYMAIARRLAMGYQEGDDEAQNLSPEALLEGIERTTVARMAMRRDGGQRRYLGKTRGGGVMSVRRAGNFRLEGRVGGPN